MARSSSTTRRTSSGLGALVLVAALAACGGDDDSTAEPAELDPSADLSTQSITVSNWAGYMPEDVADQFEAATGATMSATEHATNEEVMAKLTAGGGGIDVAFVSGQYAQALNDAGLLEPIHEDLVPNLENLYPEATELAYDEGNSYSVPYTWGTTGICYRSDLVDPAPTSWNDLLDPDPAYDGKITMLSTERWLALPAQKALGYSVNTTDDAELRPIEEKLVEAKKTPARLRRHHVLREAHLRRGGDDRGVGRLVRLRHRREPRHQVRRPRGGHDLWVDTMVVLKDSENKEAAFAFINMMLDASECTPGSTENVYYNVPNEAAIHQLPGGAREAVPEAGRHPARSCCKGESSSTSVTDSPKYTEITATDVDRDS